MDLSVRLGFLTKLYMGLAYQLKQPITAEARSKPQHF